MTELRAALDGCEVTVRYDAPDDLTDEARAILAELAEAMYEQFSAEQEVAGFAFGMGLGDLASIAPTISGVRQSCWGFDANTGHCTWNSSSDAPIDQPSSCTIHTVSKR